MILDVLIRYWALIGASVLGTGVLLFVLYRLYEDSSRGRLRATVRALRSQQRAATQARAAAHKAANRLEQLRGKADKIKPRSIEEAAGALEDARALQKIAADQLLIARNHVRKVILEEFPPRHHEALRRRFLPVDEADSKPFTMDG